MKIIRVTDISLSPLKVYNTYTTTIDRDGCVFSIVDVGNEGGINKPIFFAYINKTEKIVADGVLYNGNLTITLWKIINENKAINIENSLQYLEKNKDLKKCIMQLLLSPYELGQ